MSRHGLAPAGVLVSPARRTQETWELVAPALSQPAGCTSIVQYGATPDDNTDDTAAIQRAVTDDENGVIGCVWIPSGRFRQEQKILSPDPTRTGNNQKGIRNVTVRGAGMWYSVLYTNTFFALAVLEELQRGEPTAGPSARSHAIERVAH